MSTDDPALSVHCSVCEADPGEPCYFRPSSSIPNGEGYKHMVRGMLAADAGSPQ